MNPYLSILLGIAGTFAVSIGLLVAFCIVLKHCEEPDESSDHEEASRSENNRLAGATLDGGKR